VPIFVETFNVTREGVDTRASLHICFSNYNSLFPHIEAMDECYELQLEFSNRHFRELGTKAEDRPGYDVLERLAGSAWHGNIGLGVIDIHTNFIEPPELGRDRILYAARARTRAHRGQYCCVLRTRNVSLEELKNLVEDTRLAEKAQNGS
jgi:5-methyltetrahydropteroyltriglutamate--homocysteine methyltransferase